MTQYIGIDVSKHQLDVAIDEGVTRYPNTVEGIASLAQQLLKAAVVVVEATGGCEHLLVQTLAQQGVFISVVNPKWVKDFGGSTGRRAKNDALDAQLLQAYAKANVDKLRQYRYDATLIALKELVSIRVDIVKSLTQYKNRLQQVGQGVKAYLAQTITALKQQLVAINAAIETTGDALIGVKTVLTQVVGIGPVSASVLLAEIPELGTITGKQAAALAGVAPFVRQSGSYRGKQFCHGGRQLLRTALYMAANCARRHNPVIKAFYDRLRENGKAFKVAVLACARKLLVIINAKMRDFYAIA